MRLLLNYILNPISSLFATFLTFIHYLIIAIPFYIALIPFIRYVKEENLFHISSNLFMLIIIGMFTITIIYLMLDLIFGFTVNSIIRDTKEIKELKKFEVHQELFEEVIEKFDIQNVKFLLQDSYEVNAYAVASFRKKYVVVTTSMLKHISTSFETIDDRRNALKGLIGHELSHLINGDFLPNLILLSGEHVSKNVQRTFEITLNILSRVVRIVPIIGPFLSLLTIYTYTIFNYILLYSYKYLIKPIYNLFERFLSRRIEYRCDYQSVQALNWESMYLTLYSLLSLNGSTYHSPFSTHPNTISRILNIYNKNSSTKRITVNLLSKYFGVITLTTISFFLFYFYISKLQLVTQYLNYINKQFYILSDIVVEQILRIKKTVINIEVPTINYLPKEYENYYILFLLLFVLFFIYLFIKPLLLNIRINAIKNKLNMEIDTPLDILLIYSIINNDINSFVKILECGANIKSKRFTNDIYSFTRETNPKFMKYLIRLKI